MLSNQQPGVSQHVPPCYLVSWLLPLLQFVLLMHVVRWLYRRGPTRRDDRTEDALYIITARHLEIWPRCLFRLEFAVLSRCLFRHEPCLSLSRSSLDRRTWSFSSQAMAANDVNTELLATFHPSLFAASPCASTPLRAPGQGLFRASPHRGVCASISSATLDWSLLRSAEKHLSSDRALRIRMS